MISTTELYQQLSRTISSLSGADLVEAVDEAEHTFNRAVREHGMKSTFVATKTGRPVDHVLAEFEGHTLADVAEAWSQLRAELADELAKRGTPTDLVREMREGGHRSGGSVVDER